MLLQNYFAASKSPDLCAYHLTHRHQTKVAGTAITYFWASAFAPLRPLACGVGVGVGGAGSGGRSDGEEGGSGTADRHKEVNFL